MLNSLSHFNPIAFLGINTSTYTKEEIEKLQLDLFIRIGQYAMLSFADEIPQETFDALTEEKNGSKILAQLRIHIPDFDNRLLSLVEQFKSEYQIQAL